MLAGPQEGTDELAAFQVLFNRYRGGLEETSSLDEAGKLKDLMDRCSDQKLRRRRDVGYTLESLLKLRLQEGMRKTRSPRKSSMRTNWPPSRRHSRAEMVRKENICWQGC